MANRQNPGAYGRNLLLATLAGQVGCVTIIFVMVALFLGLWLDAQFNVKGLFTILLLVLSVPISLFVVFRIALRATAAIQSPVQQTTDRADAPQTKEESH